MGAAGVAEDDAGGGGGRVAGRDVGGHSGRDAAGHDPVQPHRARADLGPDAGRPESQRAIETIGQRGALPAGQQLVELGLGLRVGVSVTPGRGPGGEAASRLGKHALPCCAAADSGAGTAACAGGQRVTAAPYRMAATRPPATGGGSVLQKKPGRNLSPQKPRTNPTATATIALGTTRSARRRGGTKNAAAGVRRRCGVVADADAISHTMNICLGVCTRWASGTTYRSISRLAGAGGL